MVREDELVDGCPYVLRVEHSPLLLSVRVGMTATVKRLGSGGDDNDEVIKVCVCVCVCVPMSPIGVGILFSVWAND